MSIGWATKEDGILFWLECEDRDVLARKILEEILDMEVLVMKTGLI